MNTGTMVSATNTSTESTTNQPCYPTVTTSKDEASSPLTQLTLEAGFSHLAPRLQQALDHMSSPDNNVVHSLNENVSRLQDSFVDTLYSSLADANIDLSTKLTLSLSSNGKLRVHGEHPEKVAIEDVLGKIPELSAAFLEIASQSAALRDIHNLHTLVMSIAGINHFTNASKPPKDRAYQISIKGEMNHFYFNNPHFLS